MKDLTLEEQAARWELWEAKCRVVALAEKNPEFSRLTACAFGLALEFRERYGDEVPPRVVLAKEQPKPTCEYEGGCGCTGPVESHACVYTDEICPEDGKMCNCCEHCASECGRNI